MVMIGDSEGLAPLFGLQMFEQFNDAGNIASSHF